MSRLDNLRKEYRKTMLDAIMDVGTPEEHKQILDKAQRLMNEIQEESIRVAKNRKR